MARIIWSNRSLQNLLAIRDYIAKDAPETALRFIKKLRVRIHKLKKFPYSGTVLQVRDGSKLRELSFGNYRILF